MVFDPISRAACLLTLCVSATISLSSCSLLPFGKSPEDPETSEGDSTEETTEEASGFSLTGFLFGRKKADKSEPEKDPASRIPAPEKVTVGTVHLVNDAARFVLIRSSRLATIPDRAEMLTYTAEGRPTGKLRISPERKGSFLVADILEGNPNANDAVIFYGITGADGNRTSGETPAELEVLE